MSAATDLRRLALMVGLVSLLSSAGAGAAPVMAAARTCFRSWQAATLGLRRATTTATTTLSTRASMPGILSSTTVQLTFQSWLRGAARSSDSGPTHRSTAGKGGGAGGVLLDRGQLRPDRSWRWHVRALCAPGSGVGPGVGRKDGGSGSGAWSGRQHGLVNRYPPSFPGGDHSVASAVKAAAAGWWWMPTVSVTFSDPPSWNATRTAFPP